MKDRQPTQVLANGAIRYGIYNADGTLARYEYMKREDAPTVEGTPLNKANLLSDDAAMKIWPDAAERPEDPTVSEALVEAKKGSAKIGDIKITAREIDSSAWLPCDGRTITSTEYPELHGMLRSNAIPGEWTTQSVTCSDGSTFSGKRICCANNTFFAIGNDHKLYKSLDAVTWDPIGTIEKGSADVVSGISVDYRFGNYYIVVCGNMYNPSGSSSYYNYSFAMLDSSFAIVKNRVISTSSDTYNYALRVTRIFALTESLIYIAAFSWNDLYDSYNQRFISNNAGDSFTQSNGTSCRSVWTTDYDASLERIYEVYNREVGYRDKQFNTYIAVGSVPNSMISSDDLVKGSFIDLETNTIVIAYLSGYRLKYVYSTDRGATWSAGGQIIQASTTSADDTVAEASAHFTNGLLLLTAQAGNVTPYLCSMSDPANGFYTTADHTGVSALSESGLAVSTSSTANTLDVCDYSASAKPIPTITPDTRSHAYIKALEE